MAWIGAEFTLSFHVPCLFIYNDFLCILPFMTDSLFLYKKEPCFCKQEWNIEIEKRSYSLEFEWFLCETCSPSLCLILWAFEILKWRHSHSSWKLPPSKWHDHSHCLQPHKFSSTFHLLLHVHSISRTLNMSFVVSCYFNR